MRSLSRTIGLLVAALLIVGAMVVPTAATAATGYFSQVTTVKVAISWDNGAWNAGGAPGGPGVTAWCPVGYKVTGGGFDVYPSGETELADDMPTSNRSGRQGWNVRPYDANPLDSGDAAYVYALCIR